MTDYASPVTINYSSWPDGKLWLVTNEAGNICLIDWHGNTLLEGEEDDLEYSVWVSDDSKYVVIRSQEEESLNSIFTIYAVGE